MVRKSSCIRMHEFVIYSCIHRLGKEISRRAERCLCYYAGVRGVRGKKCYRGHSFCICLKPVLLLRALLP